MLKVYRRIDQYNPIYAFSTWIYSVARNHCINYANKCKIPTVSDSQAIAEAGDTSAHGSQEMALIHQEMIRHIDRYLQELDPVYQQMAFLCFYEGMKLRQIAHVLDVPVGTVKSRIHLIRRELKKTLEALDDVA